MKQLLKQFEGRGEVKDYSFKQLHSSPKAYVYSVTHKGVSHYEVFKHKENNRYSVVSYPSSKSFGLWAWTFMSYKEALIKFNNINEQAKELL